MPQQIEAFCMQLTIEDNGEILNYDNRLVFPEIVSDDFEIEGLFYVSNGEHELSPNYKYVKQMAEERGLPIKEIDISKIRAEHGLEPMTPKMKKNFLRNILKGCYTSNPHLDLTYEKYSDEFIGENAQIFYDRYMQLKRSNDYSTDDILKIFADVAKNNEHFSWHSVQIYKNLASKLERSNFDKIESVQTSFKTFHEGLSILYDYDKNTPDIPADKLEEIEQIYPNFGLLTRLLNNPDFSSKIEDSSFQDKSGYSEISKEIINLAYKEKISEIENIKSEMKSLSLEYTEIETHEKTDDAFESLYPQKEKFDEEKRNYEQELQIVTSKISELNGEIDENSLIVNPESRTIFQKLRNLFNSLFNRGKIKNSERIIASNTEQIEKLLESQKEYEQKIADAERKSLQTEMKFKQISGKETTLEQYKTQKMQELNDENQVTPQNNTERKEAIQKRMHKLTSALSIKETELQELIDTGLVKKELLNAKEQKEETELDTFSTDTHSDVDFD